MLLKQIKGFYHEIFLLVGSYIDNYQPCLAGIFKDAYIIVHVKIDCGI